MGYSSTGLLNRSPTQTRSGNVNTSFNHGINLGFPGRAIMYMVCQVDDSSCCHDTIQKANDKNCNLKKNLQIITTRLVMVDKNGSSAHNAAADTPNQV